MKRCRRNVATLSIFASVLSASWMIPTIRSETMGSQFISQECSGMSSRQRTVQVNEVALLCDSGQGSTYEYEDRGVCLSGDTAKAAITFDLYTNGRNLTEIFIDIEARILGKKMYIENRTSICDLESVSYWAERESSSTGDDAVTTPCPTQDGLFSVFISFTVPYTSNDATLKLTPDLRIRFFDASNNKLGCVETGDLAKSAFSQSMERKGQQFFLFSFLLLCILLTSCILGHQRRRRKHERAAVKKHASIMRRFHYIQTTQSGEVQLMTTMPSFQGSYSRASVDGSRSARPHTIPEAHDDSSSN